MLELIIAWDSGGSPNELGINIVDDAGMDSIYMDKIGTLNDSSTEFDSLMDCHVVEEGNSELINDPLGMLVERDRISLETVILVDCESETYDSDVSRELNEPGRTLSSSDVEVLDVARTLLRSKISDGELVGIPIDEDSISREIAVESMYEDVRILVLCVTFTLGEE